MSEPTILSLTARKVKIENLTMMKIVLDDSRKRLQSEVQKEEEIVGISNVHDQDVEMEDVSNNEAVESVIEESSNKRRRIANSENDGVDVEGTGNTGIAHNNNNAQSVNIGPSVQPSPEIQTDNKPSSQVMETKESSYKIHRVSLDSDTATYVRGLSQASSSQPDDNVTDKHSNNHPNVQISTKMRSAREGNMRFRSSRPPNLVSSVVSMTDSMVSSSLITSSLDLSELEKYDPDHEEPTEHIEPDEKTDLCWKTHMVERIMTDLFVVTAIVLFLFSMTLCLCHQFSTSVIKSAIISAIPFSASSVISNSSSPIPQMTSMSADHFFAPLKQHLWADSLRIPPLSDKNAVLSPDMTLRKYLNSPDGFHLGMAPAFFGFYAYFGALMTLDELRLLPSSVQRLNHLKSVHLKSVSGSSAGAMVSVHLHFPFHSLKVTKRSNISYFYNHCKNYVIDEKKAASLVSIGLPPRDAAKYVSSLDFKSFADFPGFGGFLKGAKFEQMLRDYIASSHQIPSQKGVESINIENSLIPLAIPVFDVSSMKEVILTEGDMAKATRSSATFPGK